MTYKHNVAALLSFSFACSAIAQNAGSISGTVRDEQSKPVPGAVVLLTSSQTPPLTLQVVTTQSGEYHLINLGAADYAVSAQHDGYTASPPQALRIVASSNPLVVNLNLTHAAGTPPPPLQFQASGLHGLIDPGGYSAAANADAASGLLRSIADLKRADNTILASEVAKWPCTLASELKKNLADHPESEEANLRLGQFYLTHHQPVPAIPLLKHARQINTADGQATRQLAIAYLQSGEFRQARALLTLIAQQPGTHALLAKADEGSGMFLQAAEEYRLADREDPGEENALSAGYEDILAGTLAPALAAFQSGEERYPHSVPLRIGVGTVQFLEGHASSAVHSFLEAIRLDPADPRPYPFLAAASAVADTDRAQVNVTFKGYLDRSPNSADANYFLARILAQNSAEADAARIEALLRRALQLDPNLAKAHLQLADLYARRNDLQQAVAEYEMAVRLAPTLTETHYRLALAYKRQGQPGPSAQQMEIFQQLKSAQTSGNDDINLAQFISVIDPPQTRATAGTPCSLSDR